MEGEGRGRGFEGMKEVGRGGGRESWEDVEVGGWAGEKERNDAGEDGEDLG